MDIVGSVVQTVVGLVLAFAVSQFNQGSLTHSHSVSGSSHRPVADCQLSSTAQRSLAR